LAQAFGSSTFARPRRLPRMSAFVSKRSAKKRAAIQLDNEFHHWPQLCLPRACTVNGCCDVALGLATYPMWHLKTQEQAAGAPSAAQAARGIMRHHGLLGLYKGGLFGITGLLPATSAYLCAYECSKYHLGKRLPHSVVPALAAAIAECSHVVLATPVEVVTVRVQCSGPSTPRVGAAAELRELWRIGGLQRLYSGGALNLASSIPEGAFWWVAYENCKALLRRAEVSLSTAYACSGVVASTIATLLVNPIDVLKTRAQAGLGLSTAAGLGGEFTWPFLFARGLIPRLAMAAVGGLFESASYETVMYYGRA